MQIVFSGELDPDSVNDPSNYNVKVWSLKRTENYGSKHYDEHGLKINAARLERDGLVLQLRDDSKALVLRLAFEGASEEVVLEGEGRQTGLRS